MKVPDPQKLEFWMVVKLLHKCWELNSGLLQKQQVFLVTDPPLQPPVSFHLNDSLGSKDREKYAKKIFVFYLTLNICMLVLFGLFCF